MFSRVKNFISRWLAQADQIEKLTAHVITLQAQFKYLQQRLDRMEVPR